MARKVDLTSETVTRQQRKNRTFGTQTPLASTTVERGFTHWTDASEVNIDGLLGIAGTGTVTGYLGVTGVLDVTGTLNGSGTNNFDGINNLSGENHLTGPTDVAGNFEIIAGGQFKAGDSMIYPDGSAKFGALGIASDGTLQAGFFELRPDGSADFGDLNISKDGVLTTGDTKIDTTGRAEFGDFIIDPNSAFPIQAPGGRMISNGTNQIGLETEGASVTIESGSAVLSCGLTFLQLTPGLAQIVGALQISSTPSAPASQLTPLGVDSSGNIKKIA